MGVSAPFLMRKYILPIIITLVILFVAVTQLDLVVLGTTLAEADLSLILLALLLWVFLFAGKVVKWKRVVASLDHSISWSLAARTLLIGFFISIITPGRLGDFARAAYLSDRMSLGHGVLAVFIDRILDIAILLLFAGIGALLLVGTRASGVVSAPIIIGLFLLFLIGIRIGMSRRTIRTYIWPLFVRFAPQTMRRMIHTYGGQFYDGIPIVMRNKWIFVQAIFFGLFSWILSVTFGWLILLALGINLMWMDALIIVPLLALVEVIPVGVLGVGTRELVAVLLLSIMGVPPELAVGFSLLHFALGYVPSFVLGAIAWNRSPLPFKGGLKGFVEQLKSTT
jgi:uncharacterized protein (TIRG00374 family)